MTDTKIQEKLKPGLKLEDLQKDGDIYLALNPDYVSGDNAKYITMIEIGRASCRERV